MKYKKYPKYKNSGIEWLGEIPEHWEVRRLKYIFDFHNEENKEKNPIILSVTLAGIKVRDISTNEGQLAKSYLGYNVVNENNIVLNPMDLISGSVGRPHVKGVVSPAYTALKPLKVNIDINFYVYLLKVHYTRKIFFPFGEGVSYRHRWTLKDETLKNFPILLPPFSEQKAIASFLDKEIEKIDTLIKKEEKLIKLLEEKKDSLITKAVTKGLKNAKMKDSGIEWLREIPEHWEVRRLKYIFDFIQTGKTPSTKKLEYYENGNINWFTPEDLNNEILKEASKKITTLAVKEENQPIFPQNSILIVGIGATTGKTAYFISDKSSFNQQITAFHSKNNCNKYFFYLLKSLSKELLLLANYTTLPILNNEFFKNLYLLLSPLQEQKQIAEYLDEKLSQIDKLIEKSKKAIELLKEKKESLITNAVTGKIDVRNCDEA